MAFASFSGQQQVVELLQRSLERQRLGHAYLFTGTDLDELEALARTLAKTLNCQQPLRRGGMAVDCCDTCLSCRKVEGNLHGDVMWVRPESKTRVIKIEQITVRSETTSRTVTEFNALKPTEGDYKVCVLVAADRLGDSAANAFLKTLEEPSARTVFILLTDNPERVKETILSRCLRLNFSGEGNSPASRQADWLAGFAEAVVKEQKSLIGRYRLLGAVLARLAQMKEKVDQDLTARSPLEKYADADPDLRDKWEEELKAAIEAEYRRERAGLLAALAVWFRDVWIRSSGLPAERVELPALAMHTEVIAARVPAEHATENLRVLETVQRQLHTNVQEALALEVGLLRMKL